MQIEIKSSDFPYIIACYLLECIQNKDSLSIENVEYKELLDKMYFLGLRSNLLWMYMNMDGNFRVKYKMIRKALFNEAPSALIRIIKENI